MSLLEWMDERGLDEAAKVLKENKRTLMSWKYGEKVPKPQTAQRITQATGLDYNEIYAPLFAMQESKRAADMIKRGVQK
ncbi:MAG: hypothetical protein ACRDDI_13370 [Aeromonas veronii]